MNEKIKTKNISQTAFFKATPEQVYNSLMKSKLHAKFSNAEAKISEKVGGLIKAYDGWIEGRNLKLVKFKKIVQKWRGSDWPKGHYSTTEFSLSKAKGGTKLKFKQTGVPIEQYNDIFEGWKEHYWQKMNKYFKSLE